MGKALMLPLLLITLLLFVAGCTTRPAPIDDPRQVWCDTNAPRRDAREDTPRVELDEINSHNAKGARWCGWTA